MHVLEHEAAPRATVDASVVARTREIFRSALELDVHPTMDVIDAGLLDSMGFVRLLFELEQEFAVTIDVASLDLDEFRTLEGVARFVEARLAGDG
jgi:D-alanine--poly(phosphoribitol) ligase subunit 2